MNTSSITTVTGAALGSACGCIIVYLGELLGHVDIPGPIEGSVVVVATALVALVYPASPVSPDPTNEPNEPAGERSERLKRPTRR